MPSLQRVRRSPQPVPRSGPPRLRPLSELLALPRRSPLYTELATALAAADALHLLHTDLEPVPVRPTTAKRRSGCYRSHGSDPVDLRVSAHAANVPLCFLHELGHLVDHQLAAEPRRFTSSGHPALKPWRAAVRRLPSCVPAHAGSSHRRYFETFRELWARSYAQTVLAASADRRLRDGLRELQRRRDPFVWAEREFAPVAAEVERALARLDLLRTRAAA